MTADPQRSRAVIGAGLMGHGIAQVLATRPGTVWLYDVSTSALDGARDRIRMSLSMLVRNSLITEADTDTVMGRIRPTTDLSQAVQNAWFAIEAAPEDVELKRGIFADLQRAAPDDAILATNSSSLTIGQVSTGVANGERVVGSHFFLPPQLVPLVEVSRGPATSDETMSRTVDLWRACGKVPIRVEQDIPGYIANRMQGALVREAVSLLQRGVATAADIDTAARLGFGIRMMLSGPLEQRDLGGLDLHLRIAKALWPDLDRSTGPFPVAREKVERGELGLDAGRGFRDWTGQDPDSVRRELNEALLTMITRLGLAPGVEA